MVNIMNNKDFYLLIDVGTGSSRVALVDEDRRIYDIQHVKNVYQKDNFGGMFIDFKLFLNNLEIVTKRVLETFDINISAITVSGARQTFFCLNKNKKVIFGIPNIDDRGNRFVSKYSKFQQLVFDKTARNISGDFLAMKLAGLREERPELFHKVYSFTSLSELFALLFCDKCIIEPSQAAETQIFNLFEKCWDPELISIFQLDSISLPELVASQTIYQITNKDLLRKFGIRNDDCKFIVGGADTQLAMKAVLPDNEKNTLCLVSGTTSPINLRTKTPDINKDHWLDLDLKGNNYVLEYNPGVTGLNYEKAKKFFLPNSSYQSIEETVDLNNIQNIFASFTTQSFLKKNNARKYGGFFISPPFPDSITKEQLIGAIALDIGFSIARKVKQLKRDQNFNYKSIVACGGGLNSRIIPQVVANITDLPVKVYENFQEPSIMGCFEVINSALNKNNQSSISKVRFEYYPQESKVLQESFEVWENLNLSIIQNKE